MSADRTHVEVVEDGDEFSVDLHDGEGEDRETVRVVTYATLAEANGLRELIAVWIRSEQDRYYALGYDLGRQDEAASGSTEPGREGLMPEAGRLVVEISFGTAHHRIEGPMGLSPRGVVAIVKAVQAALDEHERLADGPVA